MNHAAFPRSPESKDMSYTLPEFLAHAVALEQEAADRYLELADMMEAHRNDQVAEVFRSMTRYSEMHRDEIKIRVGKVELPQLKSWEFRWRSPPEVGGEEGFDYMMEPYNALRYARANEERARDYYRSVAEQASDAEVQRLAAAFAVEETEHVAALDKWIALTARPSLPWQDDPGPLPPVV
jgi:rubrerythrin